MARFPFSAIVGQDEMKQALLIAAIAASSLSMIFSVGTAMASADQSTEPAAGVALNE